MAVDARGNSEIIAFVVRRMTCHECGEAYRTGDVRVVLYDGERWLLSATCPACGAEQPVVAYDHPPYLLLHPAHGLAESPITPEEVQEWHDFLAAFEGDINALFQAD